MQKLIKSVTSFKIVEQILYGNPGAVEHRYATLNLGVTMNCWLRHVQFLPPMFRILPHARIQVFDFRLTRASFPDRRTRAHFK